MPENKQFTENDRIFYADGYRLAQSAIQEGISNESLFKAITVLYEAIDELNNSLIQLASRQKLSVDCRKGCHWCCHQAVFANSYEIHFLSEQIKKQFSADAIATIINLAEEKNFKIKKLSEEEMLKFKMPCPLLRDGSCSIYEARPMACRIYLSTDKETCFEFYQNPQNESNYPALFDFPLRAGRMMNEGFTAALKEIGINSAEFRLEEGLAIALGNSLPDIEKMKC